MADLGRCLNSLPGSSGPNMLIEGLKNLGWEVWKEKAVTGKAGKRVCA